MKNKQSEKLSEVYSSQLFANNHMIKYHYNFFVDIKTQIEILRELKWLKENNVVFFYSSPWEILKLIFKRPKINYQCEENITCYWVSGGNWGSYYPPN